GTRSAGTASGRGPHSSEITIGRYGENMSGRGPHSSQRENPGRVPLGGQQHASGPAQEYLHAASGRLQSVGAPPIFGAPASAAPAGRG
ncbi:unnamed protein product, partial [Amoebophrya sp. A25]